MAVKDLTGLKFGRLTVLGFDHTGNHYQKYWRCKCDCGNECVVSGGKLNSKWTQSCGCLQKEKAAKRFETHGLCYDRSYHIWISMKARCYNICNREYGNYGGRGIKVCDRWLNNFEDFYEDVSKLEHFGEKGYSLDRIDNDGDYCPENVRWADNKTQARNRRSNIIVEYQGHKMPLIEAAEKSGLDYNILKGRYYRGDRGERLFRKSGAGRVTTKLTEDDKKYIREKYTPCDEIFGMRPLVEKFGVTVGAIEYVLKRR